MKTCTWCNEIKDEREFYKQKSCVGGIRPRCKTCFSQNLKMSQDEKDKRHANALINTANRNREWMREWMRANRKQHCENRNKWAAKNREKARAIRKASMARSTSNIADSYVKSILFHKEKIPKELITPQLIEIRRLQIIISRALKNNK